jgi:serine/threonine-protein kinase RsbT
MNHHSHFIASATHFCADLRDRYVCALSARRIALACGFSAISAAEIAVCAAEIASNAARHAGGGTLRIRVIESPAVGIELRCEDAGPGIGDVERAVLDGWSRGRMLAPDDSRKEGLGSGLGTVRRFMDELTIVPTGQGTIVTACRMLKTGLRPSATRC